MGVLLYSMMWWMVCGLDGVGGEGGGVGGALVTGGVGGSFLPPVITIHKLIETNIGNK